MFSVVEILFSICCGLLVFWYMSVLLESHSPLYPLYSPLIISNIISIIASVLVLIGTGSKRGKLLLPSLILFPVQVVISSLVIYVVADAINPEALLNISVLSNAANIIAWIVQWVLVFSFRQLLKIQTKQDEVQELEKQEH